MFAVKISPLLLTPLAASVEPEALWLQHSVASLFAWRCTEPFTGLLGNSFFSHWPEVAQFGEYFTEKMNHRTMKQLEPLGGNIHLLKSPVEFKWAGRALCVPAPWAADSMRCLTASLIVQLVHTEAHTAVSVVSKCADYHFHKSEGGGQADPLLHLALSLRLCFLPCLLLHCLPCFCFSSNSYLVTENERTPQELMIYKAFGVNRTPQPPPYLHCDLKNDQFQPE